MIEAYNKAKISAFSYYNQKPYSDEIEHFSRILETDILGYPKNEMNSGGYVIDTLEASLWCLLKNDSYKDTVLSAVNLGSDTDTTAAVAGGLAGIYYGFENIPVDWVNQIARKDEIIALANNFYNFINRK